MCTFAFFLSSLLSTLGGGKPNKVTFKKKSMYTQLTQLTGTKQVKH